MKRPVHFTLAIAIGFLLAGASAHSVSAQQPQLTNAKIETRSASAGLDRTLRELIAAQTSPAWIGYFVPRVMSDGSSCCWSNWNGNSSSTMGCCLEEGKRWTNTITGTSRNQSMMLEGPRNIFVLYRVENREIVKIRTFTEDCPVDAGGLTFYWLTDVKPAESVATLEREVQRATDSGKRNRDEGISAIAQHADAAADRAMEQFVASGQPESLRDQAVFWLGNARGERGLELLKRLARQDASSKVRDRVTFALSVSRAPGALDELFRMAKEDESSRVRGQALFWIGQKAGRKAAEAITSAIEDDPDTEVKKKAVFALSQLPKDEGVPLLINVAKTNKNPAVRKQAMFWLGQSNDPRALAFFEEVLTK